MDDGQIGDGEQEGGRQRGCELIHGCIRGEMKCPCQGSWCLL